MSNYWAFISYAREDKDKFLERFLADLRAAIKVRTTWDERYLTFVDSNSITPGAAWPDLLASALQSARVLISIYTPKYFTREYCGKEVQVFLERIDDYMQTAPQGAPRPTLIVPILWVPERYVQALLPPAVRDLQYTYDAFGKNYAPLGVLQLMKRKREAYKLFLDNLVEHLMQVVDKYPLQPYPTKPALDELDNAFAAGEPQATTKSNVALAATTIDTDPAAVAAPTEIAQQETVGPRYVQFIFVAGSRGELASIRQTLNHYGSRGDEWQPYLPEVDEQIKFLTAEVALRERLFPMIVELDDDSWQRIGQAEDDNNIIVVVVDTWTLRLARYAQFMQTYDQRDSINCVVLVPWNPNDPEAVQYRELLKGIIYSTFKVKANSNTPHIFYEWISSPDDLKRDLSAALANARARILRKSERLRAAQRAGVNIPKPILAGP